MRNEELLAFSNHGENYCRRGWRGGHGLQFLNVRRRRRRLWSRGSHFHSERIAQAVVGNRIGDISYAVQSTVEAKGLSVVREYVGHGIGRDVHEEPEVPKYGTNGRGIRLAAGMVLAIEPMINAGGCAVRVLSDDWTVVTVDHSMSAHFEHTVAITPNGPVVLTRV